MSSPFLLFSDRYQGVWEGSHPRQLEQKGYGKYTRWTRNKCFLSSFLNIWFYLQQYGCRHHDYLITIKLQNTWTTVCSVQLHWVAFSVFLQTVLQMNIATFSITSILMPFKWWAPCRPEQLACEQFSATLSLVLQDLFCSLRNPTRRNPWVDAGRRGSPWADRFLADVSHPALLTSATCTFCVGFLKGQCLLCETSNW